MSSGKSKSKAEEGVAQAGATSYNRSKMTGSESSQYEGSFGIGDFLRQLYMSRVSGSEAPQGYRDATQQYLSQTGELGSTVYNQTLNEAKDPNAFYQSTLEPELNQAQDAVNRYYQNRGLMRSGMGIESMGRAGVDLAIKSAQGRMETRNNALNRAGMLTDYIQGIEGGNLQGLGGLYELQQNFGLQGMNRQAQAAQGAAQYQAAPYTARLGDIYGQRAAMYALPGQIIGAIGNAVGGARTGGARTGGGCWVAAEVFDNGWDDIRTHKARYFVNNIAPEWFKNFYLEYGEGIAKFIKNKPIFKFIIRPIFEWFVKMAY